MAKTDCLGEKDNKIHSYQLNGFIIELWNLSLDQVNSLLVNKIESFCDLEFCDFVKLKLTTSTPSTAQSLKD